jgi:hypothetical protein
MVADAQIDVRLAEVDRQQLGMAVGDVQQADVAEAGQVIHPGGSLFGQCQFAVQCHAASRCHRQHLEKLTTIHAHCLSLITASTGSGRDIQPLQSLLTGDSGSSRKATMWVICSGVSQLCSPKRGMLVHAVKAFEL